MYIVYYIALHCMVFILSVTSVALHSFYYLFLDLRTRVPIPIYNPPSFFFACYILEYTFNRRAKHAWLDIGYICPANFIAKLNI